MRPELDEVRLFRLAMENTDDVIFVTDPDGRIVYANPAFEKVYGFSQDEMLGKNPRIINSGLMAPDYYQRFWRTILGNNTHRDKHINKAKDGRLVTVEMVVSPVLDAQRQVEAFVAIQRDVTIGEQAVRDLQQSEERYRTLTESVQDLIFIVARDFRVSYANHSCARLFGLSPEGVIGRRMEELFPPDKFNLQKKLRKVFETGEPLTAVDPIEFPGDTIWLDTQLLPLWESQEEIVTVMGIARDITAQKEAEEALKGSEADYRAVFQSVNDAIFVHNVETGDIVDANRKACEMYGYSRDEFRRLNVGALSMEGQPYSQEDALAAIQRAKKAAQLFEWRAQHKSGRLFWVEVNLSLARIGDKDHILALSRDITEEKQTKDTLQETQRRLSSLMSHLPGMVYRCRNDQEWTMEFVSDNSLQLTGYRPSDLVGNAKLAYADLIHEEDRHQVWNEVQRSLQAKQPYELTYRIRTAAAEDKWVWEQGQGVFSPVGDLVCLEGLILDITQRQETKKALDESRQQFTNAFRHAAIGMALTSPEGRFLQVNESLCTMLGYSERELQATTFEAITHPDDLGASKEALRQVLGGETAVVELEKRYLNKQGEVVWVRLSASLVRDAGGNPLHLIAQMVDITTHRRLERQFLQAQKMEAVGRLAGGVAHDFNNILTGIIGYAQLAQGKAGPDSEAGKDMGQVYDLGQRAAALTRQLLTFSRQQKINPIVFNLNEAVQNISKLLGRVIGEDLELTLVCDPELDNVEADPTQMEQVIMNLAINARDAMPSGGSLTIETQNVNLDRTYADRHFEVKPGSCVMLAVTDTGQGMGKETQARIFEPFFTTKETGKGTGLGLATVYGIVKQHQGHVRVYSELGEGTTFKVYLPGVKEEAPEPIRMTKATKLPRGSGAILVAEDEEVIRDLIQTVLEGQGYTVLLASDTGEAEALLREHLEKIDLLISDVVMPGESGPELYQRLAKVRPLKVLFMSGYTSLGNHVRRLLTSNTPYLQKPFTPAELLEKVQEVLEEDPVEEEGRDADE